MTTTTTTKPEEYPWWSWYPTRMTAGAAAGFISELLLFPLESSHLLLRKVPVEGAPLYDKNNRMLRLGSRQLQLLPAFKGLKEVAVTTAPISGLIMANYELFRLWLTQTQLYHYSPLTVCFVAGFAAHTAESLLWNPVIVIRKSYEKRYAEEMAAAVASLVKAPPAEQTVILYTSSSSPSLGFSATASSPSSSSPSSMRALYARLSSVCSTIKKNHGWKGFYQGYWNTVMQGAPYLAVYYASGEYIQSKIAEHKGVANANLPTGWVAVAGMVSAVFTVCITTPLEVLRVNALAGKEAYKKEGMRGFLGQLRMKDSLGTSLSKKVPRSAIKRAAYKVFKQLLMRSFKVVILRRR